MTCRNASSGCNYHEGECVGLCHQARNAERAANIHAAKVYLAQSRHFSARARDFSFILLGWAANCRRRAMATKPTLPAQGDLFGGAA